MCVTDSIDNGAITEIQQIWKIAEGECRNSPAIFVIGPLKMKRKWVTAQFAAVRWSHVPTNAGPIYLEGT